MEVRTNNRSGPCLRYRGWKTADQQRLCMGLDRPASLSGCILFSDSLPFVNKFKCAYHRKKACQPARPRAGTRYSPESFPNFCCAALEIMGHKRRVERTSAAWKILANLVLGLTLTVISVGRASRAHKTRDACLCTDGFLRR